MDQTIRVWDVETGTEIETVNLAELGSVEAGAWAYATFNPVNPGEIISTLGKDIVAWKAPFALMSGKELFGEVCRHRLPHFSSTTRDEMRLAGYPDSEPLIDVCAGVGEARE
jgi:hypothetical protein